MYSDYHKDEHAYAQLLTLEGGEVLIHPVVTETDPNKYVFVVQSLGVFNDGENSYPFVRIVLSSHGNHIPEQWTGISYKNSEPIPSNTQQNFFSIGKEAQQPVVELLKPLVIEYSYSHEFTRFRNEELKSYFVERLKRENQNLENVKGNIAYLESVLSHY